MRALTPTSPPGPSTVAESPSLTPSPPSCSAALAPRYQLTSAPLARHAGEAPASSITSRTRDRRSRYNPRLLCARMNRDWAISRLLLVDSHSDAWCVLAWSQWSGARAAAASAGPFARWAMAAAASLAARANSTHLSARQPLVPHALRVLPSARAARAPPAIQSFDIRGGRRPSAVFGEDAGARLAWARSVRGASR